MIEFSWKPSSQIPTEHWKNNPAISPEYLVRCGEVDGKAVLGYSRYSFATESWMNCYTATESGIWEVIEWTDVKL